MKIGEIKYWGKNSPPNPYNYHCASVGGINGNIMIQEIGKVRTLKVATDMANTHIRLHRERREKIKKYQLMVNSGQMTFENACEELGLTGYKWYD